MKLARLQKDILFLGLLVSAGILLFTPSLDVYNAAKNSFDHPLDWQALGVRLTATAIVTAGLMLLPKAKTKAATRQ